MMQKPGRRCLPLPHHDGSATYVPELGTTTAVFVRVPHADGTTEVHARSTSDAEAEMFPAVVDRTGDTGMWWRCEMPVRNPGTHYRFLLQGGPSGYRWFNGIGLHSHEVSDAYDFTFTTPPGPPQWARNAFVGERLLGLAARHHTRPLRLPTAGLGLTGEAPNVFGGAPPLVPAGPDVVLPGDGPTFPVWHLS